MTNVHRATPGAKGTAARPPDWVRGSAIEALTGSAPNTAQIAAMTAFAAEVPPASRGGPTLPSPLPLSRAGTFHKAGHMVANAALVPCRSVSLPGFCDFFGPMETVRDALTRKAGLLIAGNAAERYATGSLGCCPAEMLLISFMSAVVASKGHGSVENALDDFALCSACALGPNWGIVESVEIHLHAGQDVIDELPNITLSRTKDAGRPESKYKTDLQHQSFIIVDRLIELARKLLSLGDCGR